MKKIFLISTPLVVLFSCATAFQNENITFISADNSHQSQYDEMRSIEDRISSVH
ncbi:hypothetical protein [Francisella sp. LA112445]|uniref:hypothetical protein n=1 Tax=Francisella sp. LA112445 TaxID=1395624 RepID=UPI001788BBCF|nr:hypothetical protein [Francisella sp. LA112445]